MVSLPLVLVYTVLYHVIKGNAWDTDLSRSDRDKIQFLLWNRINGNTSQIIQPTPQFLRNSSFSITSPVILLIHGWRSDGLWFGEFYQAAYLKVGDYNIISVDWGKLESINYIKAVTLTKPVAEQTTVLVKALKDIGVFEKIHVVGHSLGAHVAGFLGQNVQKMGLGKFQRITGLDPAEPGFGLNGPADRLDKTDAEFVDVMHTNSGFLWEGALTIKSPIGHVDFYPAGGAHQPGCSEVCLGKLCSNLDIDDILRGGCSHGRANYYFRESILALADGENRFLAWSCNSWGKFVLGECCMGELALMGHWLNTSSTEGSYYMHVAKDIPHALDQKGKVCVDPDCFILFKMLGRCKLVKE